MSMKLRDLIRTVRACKTAADERAVITKESALIRTSFKDESTEYRHRNVAKLLYIHMLGYPTHFGQIECIKLLASAKFNEKRIGYLALMLLLDERQEVLTLVTNSLQLDLSHTNQYVVGLALSALGNIGSAEMARDLARDVDNHLRNPNPYIRKKAALCTIRLLRRVPDMIDTFLPNVVVLLTDKNHNVLLTGVTLIQAVVEIEPSYIEKFTRLVPALVKILRKLITAGYVPEYDVGGVTDPFLQVRILALLRILGRGNAAASETMAAVLAQVATNTESLKNAGNAVLYELVNTIMAIHSEAGLKTLAVTTLGKFLAGKDPNLKYVALETLGTVVKLDMVAVQKHRAVIVECLRDSDVSIRKRALDLVYALVNKDNVRPLSKELLNYLQVADDESKSDLCAKIAAVAETYAPNSRWHIDTLVAMLSIAGNNAKRAATSTTLYLIAHETADHTALTHKLFAMAAAAAVAPGEAQQPLLQVAAWVTGEYGTLLLSVPPSPAEDTTGPVGETRTEMEVVKVLDRLLHLYYASSETKAMVLMALLKLTTRLSEAAVLTRIRRILAAHTGSSDLELQSRSVEFLAIADPGRTPALEGHRAGVLAPMPLLEEAVLRLRAGAGTGAASDAAALAGPEVAMSVAKTSDVAAAGAGAAAAGASGALDGLLDLAGLRPAGDGSGGGGGRKVDGASLLDDLNDLLGPAAPAPAKAAAATTAGAAAGAAGAAGAGGAGGSKALNLDELFSTVVSTAGDVWSHTKTEVPAIPHHGAPIVTMPAGSAGAPAAAPAAMSIDALFAPVSAPAAAAAPSAASLPLAAGGHTVHGAAPAAAAPSSLPISALSSTLDGMFAPSPAPAAARPAAAPAPAPALAPASLDSLFSAAAPAPAPVSGAGTAAAPAITLPYVFTAFEGTHVRAVFRCEKPGGLASSSTDVSATFSSRGPRISGFTCQVAPPKFVRMTLLPATGTTLGSVTESTVSQAMKLDNTQHGVKAIVLKLRLQYEVEGGSEPIIEVIDVKGFPLGL